jgi:hypothetical protein
MIRQEGFDLVWVEAKRRTGFQDHPITLLTGDTETPGISCMILIAD